MKAARRFWAVLVAMTFAATGLLYTASPASAATPPAVDWTSLSGPVRNQGDCGSSYAFVALDVLQAKRVKAGNSRVVLSEQQIVDCDTLDNGCNGGYYATVWKYLHATGGAMSNASYPYIARKGSCRFVASKVVTKLSSKRFITPASTSFADITAFIAAHGPVAASIDAAPLQNYDNGIVPGSACPGGGTPNQAVTIVGYDTVSRYFKVKNSWGSAWGESGYFRVAPTACGINKMVQFPTG